MCSKAGETRSGGGKCDALSLLDYSGTPTEYESPDTPLNLAQGKNTLRIFAPPSGTTTHRPFSLPEKAVIRRSGGLFRIQVPPETDRVRLLSLDGRELSSRAVVSTLQPFLLPVPFKNGIYIVSFVTKKGSVLSTIINATY